MIAVSEIHGIAEAERLQYQCLEQCKIHGPPSSMYYLPNFISKDEELDLIRHVNSAPLPQWRTLSRRRLQSIPFPLTSSNVLIDAPLPEWLDGPMKRLKEIPLVADHNSADEGWHSNIVHGKVKIDHIFSKSPHQGPNHCLVNEYLPGQGIMPHEDGPAYFPITATISLGSHVVLNVKMKNLEASSIEPAENRNRAPQGNIQAIWRVLCEPRSLLVTTSDAYVDTLHGIDEIAEDRIFERGIGSQKDNKMPIVANWDLLGNQETWIRSNGTRQRGTRISLTYRDVLRVKSIKGFGPIGSKAMT